RNSQIFSNMIIPLLSTIDSCYPSKNSHIRDLQVTSNSLTNLPSSEKIVPKYLNSETCSSSSPSNTQTTSSRDLPTCITLVLPTLIFIPNSSHATLRQSIPFCNSLTSFIKRIKSSA